MFRHLSQCVVPFGKLVSASVQAQDPYLCPSLEVRESLANTDGALTQPHLAMTRPNVVNVRKGEILRGVTVTVKDGRILSVDKNRPPAGATRVDLRGLYVSAGFFGGLFHGAAMAAARRSAILADLRLYKHANR